MPRLLELTKAAVKRIYRVQDICMMIIGCFLMALSINQFLDPHNIAPGGVTGLAIVINNMTNIPVWIMNLVFNIPLFLCAIKLLKKDALKTLWGIALLTLFLKIVNINPVTNDVYIGTSDYVSEGDMYVFSKEAKLKHTFGTGGLNPVGAFFVMGLK